MLKKRIKLVLTFLTLFVVQFSCFPHFTIHNAVPELLAILIVFYACYAKLNRLCVFAFFVGLSYDLFTVEIFGLKAVACFFGAYLISYVLRKVPQHMLIFRVLVVSVFVITTELIFLFTTFLFDYSFNPIHVFFYRGVPTVLYTVAISPFLLLILKYIMKDSLRQYNLF